MDSLDALLCDCLDQMIEANAHNLQGQRALRD
jgi:hypothetical protein